MSRSVSAWTGEMASGKVKVCEVSRSHILWREPWREAEGVEPLASPGAGGGGDR